MGDRSTFSVSPVSLISAGLLYTLLVGFTVAAGVVVPHLIELIAISPRLAMLGFFALAISPGVVAAVAHLIAHGALDAFDLEARAKENDLVTSAWAGAQAWLTLYGTSVLTSLVLLVIHPPEPPDPDRLGSLALSVVRGGAFGQIVSPQTAIWVLIAATFYELSRRARR
jgi:hypothetical protein